MIRAAIDIGSNSVLLLACEFSNQIDKELLNLSHITSLGKDLDKTGVFQDESMLATLEALDDYKNQLALIGISPSETIVTATEAARVAKNASMFFLKIKKDIGFNIQIISGAQEAYYTALGVSSGIPRNLDKCVIMDIGGASTEFINLKLNPFVVETSISLPIGSVRASDWKNSGLFESKMAEIEQNDLSKYETDTLICVAGGMTSLAAMLLGKKIFNDKEIDGLEISFSNFEKFCIEVQSYSPENLLNTYPFLGKRSKMISAAALVALRLAKKLKVKQLQISTRGLRFGILVTGEIK